MRTTTMTPIRRLRCIERSVNRERAGPVKSGGCECAGCTSNRTSVAVRHVAHGARTDTAYTPAAAPGCTRRKVMKLRFLVTICALLLVVSPAGAAAAATEAAPVYYVSLGDSLAAGTQPPEPANLFTNQGYADQLAADLRARMPTLQLVKLGCPGETTASMITPDLPLEGRNAHKACQYPHGSQLAEAVSFLHAHQRSVALVTIDIGPNDLFRGGGVPAIAANLPGILAALREAAGPDVPIIGMNFYDPFLAPVWFTKPAGLGTEIAQAVGLNGVFDAIYAAAGIPVADVGTAFQTTVTTPIGGVPLNVLRICAWTWMCAPAPLGPDIHANAAGYHVIALAFEAKL